VPTPYLGEVKVRGYLQMLAVHKRVDWFLSKSPFFVWSIYNI
jgi:hypothetical protein